MYYEGRPFTASLDEFWATNVIRIMLASNCILTNALLVYILCQVRSKLISQCNLLIALLAIGDIVVGAGAFVRAVYAIYATETGIVNFSRSTCARVNLTTGSGMAVTLSLIVALATDRLLAVLRPLSYGKRINTAFVGTAASVSVLLTSLFATLMLLDIDESQPIPVCTAGLSAGPYFLVPWTLYGQITTLTIVVIYGTTLALFMFRTRTKLPEASDSQWVRIQRKVTASILLLLAVYVIFMGIPMGVIFFSNVLGVPRSFTSYVTFASGFGSALSSGLSFYIYLYMHADVRRCTVQTLTQLLPCFKQRVSFTIAAATVPSRQRTVTLAVPNVRL